MTNKQWDEVIKRAAKEIIDNVDEFDERLFSISNCCGSTTYTIYKCSYKNDVFYIKHSNSKYEVIESYGVSQKIVDKAIELIKNRH